jgi:hypothetical protein
MNFKKIYIAKKIKPTTRKTMPVSNISLKTGFVIQISIIKSIAIINVAMINKIKAVNPATLGKSKSVIN